MSRSSVAVEQERNLLVLSISWVVSSIGTHVFLLYTFYHMLLKKLVSRSLSLFLCIALCDLKGYVYVCVGGGCIYIHMYIYGKPVTGNTQ